MLPPLGLSLTSVTLQVERLFCLGSAWKFLAACLPCMPATLRDDFLLFLLLRGSEFQTLSEPQTCGGEREVAFERRCCLMSKIKFLKFAINAIT